MSSSSIHYGGPGQPRRRVLLPLDVEAYAPLSPLVSGETVYLTHAYQFLELVGGVRLFCPNPGSGGAGSCSVEVLVDGEPMFAAPLVLTGQVRTLTREDILPAYRTVSRGARLDLRITALPAGYSTPWRGMRVVFVHLGSEVLYDSLYGPDGEPVFDPGDGGIDTPG